LLRIRLLTEKGLYVQANKCLRAGIENSDWSTFSANPALIVEIRAGEAGPGDPGPHPEVQLRKIIFFGPPIGRLAFEARAADGFASPELSTNLPGLERYHKPPKHVHRSHMLTGDGEHFVREIVGSESGRTSLALYPTPPSRPWSLVRVSISPAVSETCHK